ncbi:MAG: hypothetical protein LBN94_00770 [Puniceicoccales bacterium]|jgi:hypothetical protein|nr:hypothetical protein [Puniceicoccales bacterium]
MDVEIRTRGVIKDIFRELGQMSGFIPGIGPFRAEPLDVYDGRPSDDTLQHITIFFVHENGSLEKAGILSPRVLFSRVREEPSHPIVYFSLRLDFLRNFDGIASMRYGQEVMLEIIRRHFETLNDRTITVYFEHCSRFDYHKAALLAGSIPGWVTHRSGSGRAFRGMKGHFLALMDRFLHCKYLGEIPAEDLFRAQGKLMTVDGVTSLVPRYFTEYRSTTLSFIRLWNCDLRYEYVYDMGGKFWIESAPEASRLYVETAKKVHPERVIAFDEVRAFLQDYQRRLRE